MKMEDWIAGRIEKIKGAAERNPEAIKIPDHTLEWFAQMLESAWGRGKHQGSDEAYENVNRWRR